MKLFVAAICLLCCGNAFGQTTTKNACILGTSDPSMHCCLEPGKLGTATNPCPEDKHPVTLGARQLICDWAKDKWFCPTREPISNLDGKLMPEPSKEPCAGFKQNPDGTWNIWAHCQAGEGEEIQIPPPEPQFKLIAPPFDVPAKEWDTQYPTYGISIAPPEPDKRIVHHVACEDKTRFLLKSEDGKSHCLRFVP